MRFVPIGSRDIDEFQEAMSQAQDENLANDNAAVLDSLLARAVKANASDLHIEPRNYTYTVFFPLAWRPADCA